MNLIAEGMRPAQIAKRIHPEDKEARKDLRRRIWKLVREDAEFQARVASRARGEMVLDLIPATRRLGKRAKRLGKAQETKLLYEASGFHNPRVKHEHSGDISIKLEIPRPEKVSHVDDDVVDAEVVEE